MGRLRVRAFVAGISGCVAGFNVQTLAERRECRLDVIQTGMMPERKQAFDVGLRYADSARKFRLLQT
jgi:hypothetical protein